MQMQHVYQPVMIRTLLESGNKASIRQVAKSFLELDESQIDYYKEITKNMAGRVLKNRGVVSQDSQDYTLNVSDLTKAQRSELIAMCNSKIAEYIRTRGAEPPVKFPSSTFFNREAT